MLLLLNSASGGSGDTIPYGNCVIHLRADNTGSSTIIDEINGSGVWTFAGTAIQSATAPIAGAGSFDISNNDDTHFIRSTDTAVRAALAFNTTQDWAVRFKYRAYNWANYYAAVLGSGPGNPVFTFRDNGNEFGISGFSWAIPGGAPATGTDHEIKIARVSGRVYFFHDGTLVNPGGDAQADSYSTQTEWFICHQPHAAEFFDGWVDEVQVFKGAGGTTSSYTPAINTPFPGASTGVSCTLAVTDAADTVSASAAVAVGAALSITDSADTLAAVGVVAVAANLAGTDAADALVASGAVAVAAAVAATDAADTASGAVSVAVVANASATDAADSLAASAVIGTAPVDCALAVTDTADTVSSAAVVAIAVSLARTDASDTAASAAVLPIVATLARTDAADTVDSTAFVGSAPITASLAVTDASDTLASAAAARVSAAVSVTDANDVFASAAVARLLATLAVTDAADLLESTAITAGPVLVNLAVVDSPDLLSATMVHPAPVLGSIIGRTREAFGIRSSVQTSTRRNEQRSKR